MFGTVTRLCLTLIGAAALVALTPVSAAVAAPTQVTLHLDGSHPINADFHQGTFTASAPLCPSGSWIGNGGGTRVFTCGDGSGTFTASFFGQLEHVQGSTGPWTITDGTGTYTTLRGKGTGTVDSSTGINSSPIIFSDTWTGTADFDATAPTGAITAVKITRPHTPAGRWSVKVTFSALDNVASNPVTFTATATAGPYSATRNGTTTSGSGSFALAFHLAKRTRLLRIQIQLFDPWNNQTTITKSVRLR